LYGKTTQRRWGSFVLKLLDGFYAIGGTQKQDISTTMGKQTIGHNTDDLIEFCF
jgi:hypothetical protein